MAINRVLARCMGGRFCHHAPGTCTASPEYQAAIAAKSPTMVETTPQMLAMARRIVKRFYPEMPDDYSGRRVQIVIAAIDEEREAAAAFLKRQSDAGADLGLASEKGTTRRAAFGGGSLALHRAAENIRNGEHYNG